MHSKSTSAQLNAKEFQFDVKLPAGFYAPRNENDSDAIQQSQQQQAQISKEIQEHFKIGGIKKIQLFSVKSKSTFLYTIFFLCLFKI